MDLASVYNWCIANELSLNPAKSFFLIIPPKSNMEQPFITLNLNIIPLSPYNSVKYLGIYIDEQLNFKRHIEYIEQKLSLAVSILAQLKSFLPKPAFLRLYYALVYFYLLYSLAIWGSTFPSYLNILASQPNKAVKRVDGNKYRDDLTHFYAQLNVLKLSDLIKHETATFLPIFLHCYRPSL